MIGSRLVALAGRELGLVPPAEIDPLVVVLVLGIVADYAIFYLSGARERLGSATGADRPRATRPRSSRRSSSSPGSWSLPARRPCSPRPRRRSARSGPSLAISVLVGLVVSVTFVPAAMATLGRALFWPRGLAATPPRRTPGPGGRPPARPDRPPRHAPGGGPRHRRRLRRGARRRRVRPALDRPRTRLHQRTAGLERTQAGRRRPPREGFAPGILSPTEVLLQKAGRRDADDATGRPRAGDRRAAGCRRGARSPGTAARSHASRSPSPRT